MLDVTSVSQIQEAVDRVDTLDVLINNAGIALYDDLSNREVIEQHLATIGARAQRRRNANDGAVARADVGLVQQELEYRRQGDVFGTSVSTSSRCSPIPSTMALRLSVSMAKRALSCSRLNVGLTYRSINNRQHAG